MSETRRVCALIPAYNEAARIAVTVAALCARPEIDEIVVMDDGSTDGTADLARAAGATLVLTGRNGGKGAALAAAYAAAQGRGDIFLLLDADLGASAGEAVKLLPLLRSGEADMTIGLLPPDPEFAASGQSGGTGLVVRLARWGIARRTGQTFAQPLSGQRAVTQKVLETLGGTFAPGFGVEVELTIRALKAGFRVREVETHFRHHVTGGDWASVRHRGPAVSRRGPRGFSIVTTPMSLQAKTFLNLLAGGLAGLLAWALTDLTGWFADIFQTHYLVRPGLFGDPKFLLYGALFGLLLGLLLGIVDTLGLASTRQMQRILAYSALIGFAGGWVGLAFGQSVFGSVCGLFHINPESRNLNPAQFLIVTLGSALGYALIGGFVGAAQGLAQRSTMIVRQGAFGGIVGGLLGGAMFRITSSVFNSPGFGRFVALVVTGALVGFFVGLVQNLLKQAWIRVVLGRNEGKEHLIARPITTIGRSELADISPLRRPGHCADPSGH